MNMLSLLNFVQWTAIGLFIVTVIFIAAKAKVYEWFLKGRLSFTALREIWAVTISQSEGKKMPVLVNRNQENNSITVTGIGNNLNGAIFFVHSLGIATTLVLLIEWLVNFLAPNVSARDVNESPLSVIDITTILLVILLVLEVLITLSIWQHYKKKKVVIESRTAVPVLVQGKMVRSQIHNFYNPATNHNESRTEFIMLSNQESILPLYAKIDTGKKVDLDEFSVNTEKTTTSTNDKLQMVLESSASFLIVNPGIWVGADNAKELLKKDLTNAGQDLVQAITAEEILGISGDNMITYLLADNDAEMSGLTVNGITNPTLRDCLYSIEAINELYENHYRNRPRASRDRLGKVLNLLFDHYTVLIEEEKKLVDASTKMWKFVRNIKPSIGKMYFRCQRLGVRLQTFSQLELNYANDEARRAAQQVAIAKLTAITQNTLNENLADRARALMKKLTISSPEALQVTQLEFDKIQKIIIDSANANGVNVFVGDNKKK